MGKPCLQAGAFAYFLAILFPYWGEFVPYPHFPESSCQRTGRRGWMPAWEDRLSLADRKLLAVHLQTLAEEERQ